MWVRNDTAGSCQRVACEYHSGNRQDLCKMSCSCIRKNLYHSYTKVHYWKAGTKLIVLDSCQKCFNTNVPPQECKPKSCVLVQAGAGSPGFIPHGLCEETMDF